MAAIRPSVAFAIGLWVGGLVVGAVGVLYLRLWQTTGRSSVASAAATEKHAEEMQLAQQENTRLAAETQRLKETVEELKTREQEWEQLAQVIPSATPQRRIPFRREETTEGLSAVQQVRQWAESVESSAQAVEQLHALFANPQSDPALLMVAADSLARPPANDTADPEGRLALLTELADATTNEDVRVRVEAAQDALAKRWLDGGSGQ